MGLAAVVDSHEHPGPGEFINDLAEGIVVEAQHFPDVGDAPVGAA
ncbi:hypothetical protein [Kitasatospora cathayae]|uniref:Uncharacterized protein n=1 Tax=Kitasatospora cathayae TaxID=3004092 RepID=A0ABY7QFI6_9ACTN|nr:hypothetical protein [Kitasatospora sp. HUAS 3-15]WBP91272.1 hypothetical protein O1G21_38935 [Kitasatospora sp. HUAS 3-15]